MAKLPKIRREPVEVVLVDVVVKVVVKVVSEVALVEPVLVVVLVLVLLRVIVDRGQDEVLQVQPLLHVSGLTGPVEVPLKHWLEPVHHPQEDSREQALQSVNIEHV